MRSVLALSILFWTAFLSAKDSVPTAGELNSLLEAAKKVRLNPDTITAAKEAQTVLDAAHALKLAGRNTQALDHYKAGLQLSPWNLKFQLDYAELLESTGESAQAKEIAQMVLKRTETDELYAAAAKMLDKAPTVDLPMALDQADPSQLNWVCLVRVGSVNAVVLHDSAKKLEAVLGIPVRVHPKVVKLPTATRSAFDRWTWKQLKPQLNLNGHGIFSLQRLLNGRDPSEGSVSSREFVTAVGNLFLNEGRRSEADALRQQAVRYLNYDKQWEIDRLRDHALSSAADMENKKPAIRIVITEADLYGGDNNFLFGGALTGQREGIVSYSRYRGELNAEPPDRARLVTRMHKQLLSTVGFSLGVPRPTDPTSARSYPASLPEHDAKSEYMSEACISGFAGALGQSLPAAARKPE
jgi:predicted Zn-dependent protease